MFLVLFFFSNILKLIKKKKKEIEGENSNSKFPKISIKGKEGSHEDKPRSIKEEESIHTV